MEKEVTTLYLTFKQAKPWFFSYSVQCKTTADNVILGDEFNKALSSVPDSSSETLLHWIREILHLGSSENQGQS